MAMSDTAEGVEVKALAVPDQRPDSAPQHLSDDTLSWVDEVEALIERADLIGASRLLEAHGAVDSSDVRVLVATGRLMRLRGHREKAGALLERAVALDPSCASAASARARLALDSGDLAGAQQWFARGYSEATQAAQWVPEWIDVLLRLGQLDRARQVAHVYCRREPERAEGWFLLGLAYQRGNQYLQALDAYSRATKLDPSMAMLGNNTAAVYMQLGEDDMARAMLEQTLREEPDNALAWTNLATTLLRRPDPDAALVAIERAFTLAPALPVTLQTYSNVLRQLQQWDFAQDAAQRALALEPDNPTHVWTLAMLQLLRGDFANGWRNHEARWQGSPELRNVNPGLAAPCWQGEPLAGRTLFVWGEQGYGDAIQFVRFVPLIAQRVKREGGRLVYCCFANLLPLFARALDGIVETIVAHDQKPLPSFDCHLPLCSLPLMLGTTFEDLPVRSRYLRADPRKVAIWRENSARSVTSHVTSVSARHESGKPVRPTRRLRVGLAWTGSRTHARNRLRAVDPTAFARAFSALRDVEFFSLQFDAVRDADAAREAGLVLADHTGQFHSYDDTAAFVQSMDLVITVCTSIAHLGGALGVPTWVLLDVSPHWVWMTGRQDSPWYPSVRLYRQEEFAQWDPLLTRVAADLQALALSMN